MSSNVKNNKKAMNVLFCTPVYCGNAGDALNERQLIESLSKRVGSVYVLNLLDLAWLHPAYRKKLYLKSSHPNIKLINIPLFPVVSERFIVLYTIRLLFYDVLLLCFATLLKKLKIIDSIYVRNPEHAFAFSVFKKLIGPFAFKFAGFHTQETMVSMHSRFQRWFFINVFERINYHVVNHADLVLTHSTFYEKELKSKYGLQEENRLLVVPSGINIETIEKVKQKCRNIRSEDETNVFNSKVKIGVVGSANWWDGSDILLEAMPEILKSHPNVVLSFVFGTGDVRFINNLKLRAKALGINISIKGQLTHEEALAEMWQLTALVLPRRRTLSTEITIPIKVMEALALGVPVVITHHKVFNKMFRDFEDLIYVEPEAKDVAKKVVLLLSNPALAQRLSENGLKRANRLSYDQVSKNLADALFFMKIQEQKELKHINFRLKRSC